jgi:putative hemolysin
LDNPDPEPSERIMAALLLDAAPFSIPEFAIGIALLLLLLLFSALVSASEIAFFSLKTNDLKELHARKTKVNNLVIALRERPNELLAAILIANNLINVAIIILTSFIASGIIGLSAGTVVSFLLQVIIITSMILLVGEIIPKIVAGKFPLQLARFMAGTVNVLIIAFKPLIFILVKSTAFLDSRLAHRSHNLTVSDLTAAIDITSDESTPPEEKKMLKGIATFSEKEVRSIMKSRVKITAVEVNIDFKTVLHTILNSGFSRIPVYEVNFDKVMGILYIKDLLPFLDKTDFDWRSLIRPAFFVPENKKISDLMQEFREKKIHMAIVVDEYGGTAGLLTLEDIIEEIVGDISDEFDMETDIRFYKKIDEHNYLFEAQTNLIDFCKVMEIDEYYFEKVQGDSDTLAGLILEIEGSIPTTGTVINCLDFVFEVTDADTRRIKQIKAFREIKKKTKPNETH